MSFMRAAASKPESALPPVPVSAILGRGTRRHPQPKLVVSSPTDFHEREADRVASQVMGMPMPPAASHGGNPLNTLSPSSAVERETPAAVRDVLAEPGAPLEPTARDFMEAPPWIRFLPRAHPCGCTRVGLGTSHGRAGLCGRIGRRFRGRSVSTAQPLRSTLDCSRTHASVQQSMSGPAVSLQSRRPMLDSPWRPK